MNDERLKQEAIAICTKRFGLPSDNNIPRWIMAQAFTYVNNRENGARIGDLLVQRELFTVKDIDNFEESKPKGVLLGQHICTELEHQKNQTKRTQVQRVLCSSKAEGILFVDKFPNDEVNIHPSLKDAKKNKALLQECIHRNALIVKIAGITDAVMFTDIDQAKAFKDRISRQEQELSSIYKFLPNFKILITSQDNILTHLLDGEIEVVSEATKTNIVTEESLQGTAEHKKIASLWNHAMALGATDIHIIPSASENDRYVSIKFRIHGSLLDYTHEYKIINEEFKAILGKIGQLSNASQTGGTRFVKPVDPNNIIYVNALNKKTTFRSQIMPKGHGESGGREQKLITMRLFDNDFDAANFTALNIASNIEVLLKQICKIRGKMTLFVGTTGSGKNTTIAAMLDEYNNFYRGRKKIYSLEDPVEKLLPNVSQIQITEQAEKAFKAEDKEKWSGFLEGIVRADPDCLFLGEIRDEGTAAIAGQIAASGHELFSTFHATSPRSTIFRLLNLFTKASQRTTFIDSLGAIVTQRLVPKLCSCKHVRYPTSEEIGDISMKMQVSGYVNDSFTSALSTTEFAFQNYEGCDSCKYTGVTDLLPVNGVLVINEERRLNLLSDDQREFLAAFHSPDADINDELFKKFNSLDVSPLEM